MKVYDRCPKVIQTLGINLFETRNVLSNHSRLVKGYLDLLVRSQTWKDEDFAEYQNSRLRQVIRFAYQEIPFYRRHYQEHNVDISKIRTVSDLERLPIITKSDVAKHWDDFIPNKWTRSRSTFTSGTTGMPLEIKLSRDCLAISRACQQLRNRWAGHNGEKIARFVGDRPVSNCSDRTLYRRSYVSNRLIFPSYCTSLQNFQRIMDALTKHRIQFLQCYPSTVFILAKLLQGQDKYFPLKALLYGSEPMHGFQRKLIEERFQARAFGFYGQAESVIFASECENGYYHLAMVDGILEVVRGEEKLSPGERGHTVGTTLCNFAMPLIRYRMDDYSGIVGERCGCGRASPIIFPIETRSNDFVITPSGIILPPGVFGLPMLEAQHIVEAQIVQRAIDQIVIKVVPADGYSDADESRLLNAFSECLGEDMSVKVERVGKIHQTGTFKKRWIVSELPGDIFEQAMNERKAA